MSSVQNILEAIPSGGLFGGLIILGLFVYYVVPYLRDEYDLRKYPGPVIGRFSNFWMLVQARRHRISMTVHEKHLKYGDFVRLAPDHLSVSHPDGIRVGRNVEMPMALIDLDQDILGHGNGFLKSEFYYAFDNIEQGIFTTRDRLKHSRKRKYVSHAFSPKAMVNFEPYITNALNIFTRQMEKLIQNGQAGQYVDLGRRAKTIEKLQRKGEAAIDASRWLAFLAFDIIGDLAFGEPFGFCKAGSDTNGGIKKLRDRGEWCCTVGQMPWIKTWTPYFYFDTFFVYGLRAAQALARIGIAAVDERKHAEVDTNRKDILYYLLMVKDPDTGGPLGDSELKAEALTQLIAGSDTTGNTLTHVVDMLCRHPDTLKRLQEELDTAFPSPLTPDFVAPFSECQNLQYTQGVLYETLRLRTTVSVGLPRVVVKGGATVCGQYFKEGTVLSVPTYTIHRDRRIWGPDALEFKPERWLGDARFPLEKYFLGFSYGPRACIGRNVAFMELKKTAATLFRRFDFRLIQPDSEPYIREGFHLKCQSLPVFLSKRDV